MSTQHTADSFDAEQEDPRQPVTPAQYKAEREARGTQATVAARLGVNRVSLARRETGTQVITQEAWLALTSLPKGRSKTVSRLPIDDGKI